MSPRLIGPWLLFWTFPYGGLLLKTVFRISVEPPRVPIDDFKIPGIACGPLSCTQVLAQDALYESGARLLRSCDPIDPRQDLVRECDRYLLFHATNILPICYL